MQVSVQTIVNHHVPSNFFPSSVLWIQRPPHLLALCLWFKWQLACNSGQCGLMHACSVLGIFSSFSPISNDLNNISGSQLLCSNNPQQMSIPQAWTQPGSSAASFILVIVTGTCNVSYMCMHAIEISIPNDLLIHWVGILSMYCIYIFICACHIKFIVTLIIASKFQHVTWKVQ